MPKADTKSKTKKEKNIHPNSRKASQLSRALHKEEKKQRRKDNLDSKISALGDKIFWFKSQLEDEKQKYSLGEVSSLILRYINRFDDRLVEIKESNKLNKDQSRHGRKHAAEEDAIKMVFEREHGEFVAGKFEAPDITNRKNLVTIRNWEGDSKDIPKIKLRMFKETLDIVADIEEEETQ